MGKAGSAQFAVFRIDGFDLIPAKLQAATYKVGALQEATHGLGDRWEETTPTGLRRVTITQSGAYFDTTQNGMHEAFKDTPLTPRTLVLAPTDGAGGPLIVAAGTLTASYEVLDKLGALTRANVTYVISGAVTEGAIVEPPAAHTANWTSAPLDHGKATANGGTAAQLVTAIAGLTGFVGKLQHSPDGVAWTDLVAFPNVTTAGTPATLQVAGAIDRYVQYVGTITGTGTVSVVASLTRK